MAQHNTSINDSTASDDLFDIEWRKFQITLTSTTGVYIFSQLTSVP